MNHAFQYFSGKVADNYPFTYLDVGAMGGIPVKWHCMLHCMKVIAFEPDPREFSLLKSGANINYLNYALSGKTEDLKYFITKGSGKSSILKPNAKIVSQYENEERFYVIKEESIPSKRVSTVDDVIKKNDIRDIDFIKLDTQGSELTILQGGQEKLIPNTFGVQVEVEFIELYEHQPLFRHIDEFMDNKGFALMDIRRAFWKRKIYYDYRGKGQLVFGDALYFKKIDVFYEELSRSSDQNFIKSKIFKCILVCIVYGMLDYAIAIARAGLMHGYFLQEDYDATVQEIKKCAAKGLILNSRLYAKLFNRIKRIMNSYRPQSFLGWADSDQTIGNVLDD